MIKVKEFKNAYYNTTQRELLIRVFSHEFSQNNLFLTGGSALSIFYAGHRKSKDLDLFLLGELNLLEYSRFFRNLANVKQVISETESFCSYIYEEEIKVDFVFDKFSISDRKEKTIIDGVKINVDSIENICINKITAAVSRSEPKDIIDLVWLFTNIFKPEQDFLRFFNEAKKREALLEDYLYVKGLFNYIANHSKDFIEETRSVLLIPLTEEDVTNMIEKLEIIIKKQFLE